MLHRYAAFVDGLTTRVGRIASWATLAMVLIGAFNALARYYDRDLGTQLSSNRWIELQWYLFSIVFLLGAAWTLREQRHVRVDVLYARFPPRVQAWIDLAGSVLFLVPLCLFALWFAYEPVTNSIRILEGSRDPGGLPRWPIKTVVPIAFLLLLLQATSEIAKNLLRLRGELPPDLAPSVSSDPETTA